MPEFCTCGAQLPPDSLFCHKCGKPQRDVMACKPCTAGAGVLVVLETFPALQPERRTTRRNPRDDPDNLRITTPKHLTRSEKAPGNLFYLNRQRPLTTIGVMGE